MSQKVKGFLATDGKFFATEAECLRHEYTQTIIGLCDSHAINPDNFMSLVRAWHQHIKGYYDADGKCKEPEIKPSGSRVEFKPDDNVPPDEDDYPDTSVGDKDAPSFLEQQVGRRF